MLKDKIIKSCTRVVSDISRNETLQTLNSYDSVDYDPLDDIKISEKKINPRWQMQNSGLFPLKHIDQVLNNKLKMNIKNKIIGKLKNNQSMKTISRRKIKE